MKKRIDYILGDTTDVAQKTERFKSSSFFQDMNEHGKEIGKEWEINEEGKTNIKTL